VREAGEEQEARWRGIVKHVQSNQERNFAHFGEAMDFMDEFVTDAARATGKATTGSSNPFVETARLWGEYLPRYTRLMMETMRDTMETPFATQNLNDQMERAVASSLSAWGLPTPAEQRQAMERIAALTEQVDRLQAKIARLEKELAERGGDAHE
jgi:hypothetical protein